MMGKLWVVLFVGLAGAQFALGLPLRPPPPVYPHDGASSPAYVGPTLYVLVALGFTVAAAGMLLGCTWCGWLSSCFKHKDHKLFSSSVVTLQPERRAPAESLAEPSNNNISEDNNNGPISLREMQNIANNNAALYITSENEERNRISRESVVEFEPLPREIGVMDPLERCADWFGGDDLPRNRLQYLREIGRGWFGRVVEGEIDEEGSTSSVAVKLLNQNASLEDKARFLDENRLYKDVRHENILKFVAKYLQEDPWLLMFEFCSMDLLEWLETNRPKMAIHNERAVPLQLMSDVTGAISYLHSRGYLYGNVTSTNILIREHEGSIQAVVGNYASNQVPQQSAAPESRRHPSQYTISSEVWSIGTLLWEVCAWGSSVDRHPPPPPPLPHPYSAHLYQVMQLCWEPNPDSRPTSAQVHALVSHLRAHALSAQDQGDGASSGDFEARWQRLKPNTIPKLDEHIAIVHAPSTSQTSPLPADCLSVDFGLSRSSSIISDQMSTQIKSDSLNNLHGSLEDVRNIYLTHNETAAIECNQGNIAFDDKEDRSDSSMDPWLKDIIAGSQDDVSYYKDVSDVIKNLDNILNSEKTSSSESSHQASPSRDNLILDCKKEAPVQSSLVKSPGISNFQNILEAGLEEDLPCDDDDKDTVGTLSHSFERHSDTTSQHTLENLTPDTPVKDPDFTIVSPSDKTGLTVSEDRSINGTVKISEMTQSADRQINETVIASHLKTSPEPDIPKDEKRNAKLPNLRELTVTSITSVSENEQLNVRASCDSLDEVRTEVETKSIDKLNQNQINVESKGDSTDISEIVQRETNHNEMKEKVNEAEEHIPVTVSEIANEFVENEVIKPAIESVHKIQNNSNRVKETNEIKITTLVGSMPTTVYVHKENKEIIPYDLIPFPTVEKEPKPINEEVIPKENKSETPSIITDHFDASKIDKSTAYKEKFHEQLVVETNDEETLKENFKKNFEDLKSSPTETPEPVQSLSDDITEVTNEIEKLETASVSEDSQLPTEMTDNLQTSTEPETYPIGDKVEDNEVTNVDNSRTINSDGSTIYMDLNNDTNSIKNSVVDNFKEILEQTVHNDPWKNESTVYLDLPSILKDTNDFLHSERVFNHVPVNFNIIASTPKCSDESSSQDSKDNCIISESPENKPTLTLEHRIVPETPSPSESPTKSHPTDTYEDNSSVLGPFETQESMEHKSMKDVDIPKEELLAFSSNFSEINLATPSPLRDGNFLNEVPDIVPDYTPFEIENIDSQELKSENSSEPSGTTKFISPSTPPNSPGIFLASSQKYVVDIDIEPSTSRETDSGLSSWQKELDINHIEMQIHSKLAMAENENNMNIEYSGPLTVEGIVSEDEVNNINVEYSRPLTVEGLISEEEAILRDNDAIPEAVLAGNGGSVEDLRVFSLDDECVQALRNELELKLPLAQVASIEPANDPEDHSWSELPPPPELIVCYAGGALSPIAEETGHQLINYENDCNTSTRTDSSESYLEPCNNSTDEVTDLPTATQPTGNHSTYTLPSGNDSPNDNTYTVQKDVISSKDATMTPDSLNCSPYRKPTKPTPSLSPIDDQTYNKNDEQSCEHISQISPFLLSPTTDSNYNSPDNATTLSKTTVTTDVKPHDDISKANSIDSWCSNDTLYNVEENFDDLVDGEAKDKDDSEGTDTLHNEDKEQSHCSTYIIHESDSECDTFSPDSITEKDDYTYTKMKTEPTANTSVNGNILETNTNNQVIEAFGTIPSYSKCTTEIMSSMNDPWMLPQPEMIRRSPIIDIEFNDTQPKIAEIEEQKSEMDPNITRPSMKKMDSIEIASIEDDNENKQDNTKVVETVENNTSENNQNNTRIVEMVENSFENNRNNTRVTETIDNNTFRCDFRKMTPSVTSTPLVEPAADDSNGEVIPMVLPNTESPFAIKNIPNFQAFIQSAEIRPQDISTNSNELTTIATCTDTGLLLEGESKTLSKNSNRDSTPNFTEFESSAVLKPQELNSGSSQNVSVSSGEFRQFESSVRERPQDLSAPIDASSLFLNSERRSSAVSAQTSQNFQPSLDLSPPITNLVESQSLVFNNETFAAFITDFEVEETDQPHSIIITDVSKDIPFSPKSPIINTDANTKSPVVNTSTESSGEVNKTYDSHTEKKATVNETFNSHPGNISLPENNETLNTNTDSPGDDNRKDDSRTEDKANVNDTFNSHPENISPRNETNLETQSVETEEIRENVFEDFGNTENSVEAISELLNIDNQDSQNANLNKNQTNTEFIILTSSTPETTNKFVESRNTDVVKENHDTVKANSNENRTSEPILNLISEPKVNGTAENYATVSFINETFEELGNQVQRKEKDPSQENTQNCDTKLPHPETTENMNGISDHSTINGTTDTDIKMAAVTKDFLQNEKHFSQLDAYLPLLNDIRFSGPTSELMSTSFTESPTSPESPACEQDGKHDLVSDLVKEWDSDSDSHSSNDSSGEFIWKDGDGQETAVVTTHCIDHQRSNNEARDTDKPGDSAAGSGDSGSGSEGDEVEFVPSSWDCRAEPAKSSLRTLQHTPESKKRVVFKRQKYHCVYEYPREVATVDVHSPAFAPDYSTYSEWDPSSAEDAELGYGQLFGAPSPLDMYPLRGVFSADYDEDFFISSSARPFEALGVMSTTSQFFPGMHSKAHLSRDLSEDIDDLPAPPSPLPTTQITMKTPSLDFTTPDSGVEDITPGSTIDEDFKTKKLHEDPPWKPVDSTSSSESVSPSSPAGEALGGLRHTRDKLKLDLPPSPHIPSPRHNRVFNFILDKPKRHRQEDSTPLVMTDETPIITSNINLPLDKDEDMPINTEPTFSTFGKNNQNANDDEINENKIVLDEIEDEKVKDESESPVKETVKGEGTVLDSGDEDSGIESSSKASLERKANV